MQNKKWVAWAIALVVVLVAVAVAFNIAGRTPSAHQSGVASTPVPAATAASSPAATGTSQLTTAPENTSGSGTATASAEPTPSGSAMSAELAPSAAAASAVEEPKLEVPASATPSATTLPKSVKKEPALAGIVPKPGTARGKLTPGFPTEALPVPAGASIVDSSVGVQKQNVQAAINYRTNLSTEGVLKYYESAAVKRGWVATRGTAADGATSISLGLGEDTMTATVRTAPTGATLVSAFGAYVVGK